MEEKDFKAPFPREPWKRLLEHAADAPPETTDARIRANARKALVPHGARWWLHAGLAASFVVAVVLAQTMFSGRGKGVGGDSLIGESKIDVSVVDRSKAISPPPPPAAASEPLRREAVRPEGEAAFVEDDYEDEAAVGEVAEVEGTDSRIGGPERERRAASESPEEQYDATPATAEESKELSNVVVTGSRAEVAAEESTPSAGSIASVDQASWRQTPEEWYARIVALRKAGSNTEADAELKRFEATWPDWMKKHGKPRP